MYDALHYLHAYIIMTHNLLSNQEYVVDLL